MAETEKTGTEIVSMEKRPAFKVLKTLGAALGTLAAIAAVGIGSWHIYQKHNENMQNQLGGPECYSILADDAGKNENAPSDKTVMLGTMLLTFKSSNGTLPFGLISEKEMKAYERANGGALDKESMEKVRLWKVCVERQQKKNVPVAVQPKAIPRARNNP